MAGGDVLIVTPEKLDLVVRLRSEYLSQVSLIILDEVQLVDDASRGTKFDLLVTRLKRQLPGARFLVLSAVVPQQTLDDFARWLRGTPDDIVTSDWRPAVQRFARLEWRGKKGFLRYAPSEDTVVLQEFVPGVIQERVYEFVKQSTGRRNRPKFPEPKNKSQTAAEAAYRFAELGPVLVFCSQPGFAEAVGKALLRRQDLGAYRTPK